MEDENQKSLPKEGSNHSSGDAPDSARADSNASLSGHSSVAGYGDAPKKSRRLMGCLLKLVVVAICLAGVVFFLNQFFRPDFDPDSIGEVTVTQQDPEATQTPDDSLPETAITRGYSQASFENANHPLEPLLEIAKAALANVETSMDDYTYTMIKQTRFKGKLGDETHIFCKIRHESKSADGEEVPFSVYTRFLAPKGKLGQEGIWVKGRNNGKLIAHPPLGWTNRLRLSLDPNGSLAMSGELHPVTEIGIKNLVRMLIKTGTANLQHGECSVVMKRNVDVNGSSCTLIEVTHPVKRDHFSFNVAKIYIDDQLNMPIAYEGFTWPEKEGDPPLLEEKYFFTDIKINVGLTDKDFDPSNPDYDFP